MTEPRENKWTTVARYPEDGLKVGNFDARGEAQDAKQTAVNDLGAEQARLFPPGETPDPDDPFDRIGPDLDTDELDQRAEEALDGQNVTPHEEVAAEVVADGTPEPVEPAELSKNPIGFLESVNSDFVNTIKGTPAISKRGFRFIQREFEISTESEVVEWSDDPLGCVVWAKAELPGGYSAEAHGEGYQFESDVSDNEFVRYADTRAKNRAISDLTSAGALAVSELTAGEKA